MTPRATSHGRAGVLHRVLAVGLVLVFLLAAAMAVSPEIHHFVDGGGRSSSEHGVPAHACAAALLASGACESVDGMPVLLWIVPANGARPHDFPLGLAESVFLLGGILEHAPPALS